MTAATRVNNIIPKLITAIPIPPQPPYRKEVKNTAKNVKLHIISAFFIVCFNSFVKRKRKKFKRNPSPIGVSSSKADHSLF